MYTILQILTLVSRGPRRRSGKWFQAKAKFLKIFWVGLFIESQYFAKMFEYPVVDWFFLHSRAIPTTLLSVAPQLEGLRRGNVVNVKNILANIQNPQIFCRKNGITSSKMDDTRWNRSPESDRPQRTTYFDFSEFG